MSATQIIEAYPFNSKIDIGIDNNLSFGLPKHSRTKSSFSPPSIVPEAVKSDIGCVHSKTIAYENYDTCFHCGAFVSRNGNKTIKGKNMNYFAFFSPKEIYEAITKRFPLFSKSLNVEYAQLRQAHVEWLLELAEKVRVSKNSAHLAVILLDYVMFSDNSLMSKIQLYASVCLLVACKTIELDERIPFIAKLKRYVSSLFSPADFTKAELEVLDLVDWNAQFSSSLEIIEFLLCQGVIFSNDEIEDHNNSKEKAKSPKGLAENAHYENTSYLRGKSDPQKSTGKALIEFSPESNENSYSDVSTNGTNLDNFGNPYNSLSYINDEFSPHKPGPQFFKQNSTPPYIKSSSPKQGISIIKHAGEILSFFEENYVKLSILLIKDIDFIEWKPEIISAAMVAFFRHVNRIIPKWNSELETITRLKFSQISSCFELICKKYYTEFARKAPKIQRANSNSDIDNDLVLDAKLLRAHSYIDERAGSSRKNSFIDNTYTQDQKLFEKKPVFNYQPKIGAHASIPPAETFSTYLGDDLLYKLKFNDGPEFSQRNTIKNQAHSTSHQSRFAPPGFEGQTSYLDNSGTSATGNFLYNVNIPESYLKNDPYPSKNPSLLSNRTTVQYENAPYQTRSGFLEKR